MEEPGSGKRRVKNRARVMPITTKPMIAHTQGGSVFLGGVFISIYFGVLVIVHSGTLIQTGRCSAKIGLLKASLYCTVCNGSFCNYFRRVPVKGSGCFIFMAEILSLVKCSIGNILVCVQRHGVIRLVFADKDTRQGGHVTEQQAIIGECHGRPRFMT